MTDKNQPKVETIDLDRAIVVRNPKGEIRRLKTRMNLNVDDGTLVKIINAKKAYGQKPAVPAVLIPTATAYMGMAARSGLLLKHPDSVIVGGVEQPNGFQDSQGTYYFRAQCGGFTVNGQPFYAQALDAGPLEKYRVTQFGDLAIVGDVPRHLWKHSPDISGTGSVFNESAFNRTCGDCKMGHLR